MGDWDGHATEAVGADTGAAARVTGDAGAQVIQGGVHPLLPPGALISEILVQADPGPGLQHQLRRDPTLRQPPINQQLAQMRRVQLIGLGVPAPTPPAQRDLLARDRDRLARVQGLSPAAAPVCVG